MSIKPILFNTDMVRAILSGQKTVTRRVVRPQPAVEMPDNHNICKMTIWTKDGQKSLWYMDVIEQYPFKRTRYFEQLAPFEPGDIMYVRETWNSIRFGNGGKVPFHTEYWYKADDTSKNPDDKWRPSIHMPKEAARIFLRVTDVRVERLQDCGCAQTKDEGCTCCSQFVRLWDETIKPKDRALYGWTANPWVWVIEFDRCKKQEV